MTVKKFLITIVDDESVDIDEVHNALCKVTEEHLTTWEEANQALRTRRVQ